MTTLSQIINGKCIDPVSGKIDKRLMTFNLENIRGLLLVENYSVALSSEYEGSEYPPFLTFDFTEGDYVDITITLGQVNELIFSRRVPKATALELIRKISKNPNSVFSSVSHYNIDIDC